MLGAGIATLALVAAVSVALTYALARLAPHVGWIDTPNARSMHALPTPRGGGAAIALCVLGVVLALLWRGDIDMRSGLVLALGGAAVALIGGLDDRFRLQDAIRLPAWFAIAGGSAVLLGGMPTLALGPRVVPLGLVGGILLVLGIVWSVNLYNFMDGIDGIAGTQAVIAAGAGGLMLVAAGAGAWALVSGALAAASLGFLVWNWSPARIFMGDVGSGFIGFVFAIVAVGSERAGGPPLVSWAILVAPFLVDATFTLARRAFRKEPFHKPHRTHAYQLAVQRGRTHRQVSAAYGLMALALVPVAWLAWRVPTLALPLAGTVVLALGLLWAREIYIVSVRVR